MHAHACTFSCPKLFSQALVCWCFFWPFSVCKLCLCEQRWSFNTGKQFSHLIWTKLNVHVSHRPASNTTKVTFPSFSYTAPETTASELCLCRRDMQTQLCPQNGFPDGKVDSETTEESTQTHGSNTTVSWGGSNPCPLIPGGTIYDFAKWNEHSNSLQCTIAAGTSEPHHAVLLWIRFLWHCDAPHSSLLVHVS